MNRPVSLKIISTDGTFVDSLQRSEILPTADGRTAIESLPCAKGAAVHVPGAMQGWWEIAVAVGLAAAPISVLTSVLASWISDALRDKKPQGETKVILRSSDGRVSEFSVSSTDRAVIAAALTAALENVDRAE